MWRYVSISLLPLSGLFLSKNIKAWRFTIFMLILSGFVGPKIILTGALESYDISRYLASYSFLFNSNATSFTDVVVLDFVNRKQAIELVPALLTWVGLRINLDATGFYYLLALYFSFALGSLLFYSKERFGWIFCLSILFLIPYYGINGYRFWSGLALLISGVISEKKHYLILGMFTHMFFFPIALFLLVIRMSKTIQIGVVIILLIVVLINLTEITDYLNKFLISNIGDYYTEIQTKSGGKYLRYFRFLILMNLLIWALPAMFFSRYNILVILTGIISLFLWNVPGLGRTMYLLIPFVLLDNRLNTTNAFHMPLFLSSIISFMITSYVMREAVDIPLFFI